MCEMEIVISHIFIFVTEKMHNTYGSYEMLLLLGKI